MGDRAEQLKLALDADLGTMTTTGDVLGIYAESAGRTATTMGNVAGELGLDGDTATAAEARLAQVAGTIQSMVTRLETLQAAATSARDAIAVARDAFHELPDGELTFAERAGITAAASVVLPGVGTVTGLAAGEIMSRQREAAREQKADEALTQLSTALSNIEVRGTKRDDFEPIDTTVHEIPGGTSSTGSPAVRSMGPTGTGTISTPGGSGWNPGASGSTGLVSPSWEHPTGGTGTSTGSGGAGGSGSGSAGGGVVSTGPQLGSGGGAGSGAGPGYVPGAGDGSSSDGLVGGTIPGSTSSGNGSGTFVGGSGGAGGNGSGSSSGLGLGAGGLAGGLTVGGAALGGAGLHRLAGGGVGGTGGGGFGGVGAGGAGGSVPLGTIGTGAPGASGSSLSGSASGLGQGSQTGASGAAASGTRAGGTVGGPMAGGGGAGAANQSKRRNSLGLLAPDIEVEDGASTPSLGSGAGAGGRDSLRALPGTSVADAPEDEW